MTGDTQVSRVEQPGHIRSDHAVTSARPRLPTLKTLGQAAALAEAGMRPAYIAQLTGIGIAYAKRAWRDATRRPCPRGFALRLDPDTVCGWPVTRKYLYLSVVIEHMRLEMIEQPAERLIAAWRAVVRRNAGYPHPVDLSIDAAWVLVSAVADGYMAIVPCQRCGQPWFSVPHPGPAPLCDPCMSEHKPRIKRI